MHVNELSNLCKLMQVVHQTGAQAHTGQKNVWQSGHADYTENCTLKQGCSKQIYC